MSHRPILKKKANRVRKMMRQSLPAHIDLIAWLKMSGHANTSGEARRIIESGRVRSESHVLRDRYVPARMRGTLTVSTVAA